MRPLVSSDVINEKIVILRGHKVMVSPHLAELYPPSQKTTLMRL